MKRDFKYETSKLTFTLFELTGQIGYYQLFKEVEFGKDLELDLDIGR